MIREWIAEHLIAPTEKIISCRVDWRMDVDGKVRITTPFLIGRTSKNYGDQKGIQIGDTGTTDIQVVIEPCQPDSNRGFEKVNG